jgi:hypothetical protein
VHHHERLLHGGHPHIAVTAPRPHIGPRHARFEVGIAGPDMGG